MKNSIFTLLFLLFTSSLVAQNQQGYIYVIDKTPEGMVYYISSLFECKFGGTHDEIDGKRIEFDAQFKAYILEKYETSDLQEVQNNWLEPGRGINPPQIYSKFLENFPKTHPDAKMIMVSDFVLDCEK